MPFNCKYAIFDNDGTLMESMYYWRLAGIEYMIAHRLPIPGEMTLREMFSHSSRAFSEDIARYEPGASFESVVAEMEERMGRHYRYDVVEKPGVGDFLAALHAGGARLCVATAAPRALCRWRWNALACARISSSSPTATRLASARAIPPIFPPSPAAWAARGGVLGVRGRAARHGERQSRRHARLRHRRLHQRAAARGHPFRRRRLHKRLPPPAAHAAARGGRSEN